MTEPIAARRRAATTTPMTESAPVRLVVEALAYVGGLAMIVAAAVRAIGERPEGTLTVRRATVRQLDWLLGAGLPLVGLVHVGMGSFLAMQAYFGATFAIGVGPVVGVGLIRNGAPLLTGFVLAGLMAARATVELRIRRRVELDADPSWVADRDVALGLLADDRPGPSDGRLLLPRLIAAMVAGPALAAFGAAVGIGIGVRVADGILGISSEMFFASFAEKLWLRDVIGLVLKGAAFGAIGAVVACHEGCRNDRSAVPTAAVRAASLAMAMVLAVNLSWFFFVYLAGPPFGPTVLPT